MPKETWKNKYAAPQNLTNSEIKHLESYPDARRVNLDDVLTQSAKKTLTKKAKTLSA